MAYEKNGKLLEKASKIGHLRVVESDLVKTILDNLQRIPSRYLEPSHGKTGELDLNTDHGINRVVAVDGGHSIEVQQTEDKRRVAFIQVAACTLKLDDVAIFDRNPIADPREADSSLASLTMHNSTILPLRGMRLSDFTVSDSIREITHLTLAHTGLYETLSFLVYRDWDNAAWCNIEDEERPNMACRRCGERVALPRHALAFECPHCSHEHHLSDYLMIGQGGSEDWNREDSVGAMRDAMETLTLFHLIREGYRDPQWFAKTLFLKDGPLLLRAYLLRLVPPIREFISYLQTHGYPLQLAGVEKSGDMADFLATYGDFLDSPGSYFLPTVRYLLEEISGRSMSAAYRNRECYGTKVGIQLGSHHRIVLNVPTGGYPLEPRVEQLIGFEPIACALANLTSYRYPHALLPLILANSLASISRKPSGSVLSSLAWRTR